MQLITTKTLPPLSVTLTNLLEDSNGEGKPKFRLELGLKYCPSMDLVATYPILYREDIGEDVKVESPQQADPYGGDEEDAISVDVWRLNGQKVFEVVLETDDGTRLHVVNVEWRDDGKSRILMQLLMMVVCDNVLVEY